MQGVSILDLGQTTDHKQTGILRTEKLDLANPALKLLALFLRWLLVLVLRRHFMRLHIGKRLPPKLTGYGVPGIFKCRLKVDRALAPPVPVTLNAVILNERSDSFIKGLFGISLQHSECHIVVVRIRLTGHGQQQCQAQEERGDGGA